MKRLYLVAIFLIFGLTACSANGGAGLDPSTQVRVSMKIPATSISATEKPVSEGVLSVRVRVENNGGIALDSKTENMALGRTRGNYVWFARGA